ncbi:preprotein translocase subunit SecY [Micromonospora carbonacea]|uniref:Protein translocase subunit SecY n=1 Tax=Micromonospora carbonacea TaxID=47853 RepID=A0A1C4UFP3_9ACTN|nr:MULTISPECIES: preprotein translocase subunit SecY [Micromonospora]MBB5824275.1 preprotein translocase subunit SecY [Micromonospora carbonacea]MDG4815489.1 preprotein translocase subunit SecY [Micromonospora sp. WMMD956]QLD27504.1 preprotein translocase subunit SecY [Micromonospora carbonacea]WFE58048.1 preprotein translocase subunit SecY [Micromonospora sp. WMMD712]SCE70496.1 protein translocase subunit secY/sec61 alpha [Micromonospora carbonacea]
MLSAFLSAFRTPDLRKKLLFTVGIIAVYRLGATLPSPGVSYGNVQKCLDTIGSANTGVLNLLDLFSGGALLQLSVFALGIMPYITASIILQLLTVVIPRLEQLRKEGQAGQAKITQYTRYLTLGLGILQSSAFVALARSGQLFNNQCDQFPIVPEGTGIPDWLTLTILVMTMTAGTGVVMWLGELITDRGVGNGMSVLIFTSIAARLPSEGWRIKTQQGWWKFFLVLALVLVVITAVTFIEQAQRRIPVQYAKRMIGRRMYGGTSTYIPLKVNQAGVIPVIFGSSLLYLPQLALQFFDQTNPGKTQAWIQNNVVDPSSPLHIAIYFLLIIFFTYFYVSITFNPTEVADNMKKYGGFVPGIRPGKPTADYLDFILSRITLPGALYLGIVSILPNFFFIWLNSEQFQNFPFGGTAVLIMVGVGLETVKQIESQLMQRNYEGFLR